MWWIISWNFSSMNISGEYWGLKTPIRPNAPTTTTRATKIAMGTHIVFGASWGWWPWCSISSMWWLGWPRKVTLMYLML